MTVERQLEHGAGDIEFAGVISRQLDELSGISSEPDRLTRYALTPAMRTAADLIADWMRTAGMSVSFDEAGNVIGRYEAISDGAPALMVGSHFDTVRDAGRFDGTLGVITAISCVAALNAAQRRLPFAIEVIAFGDEEGSRFGTGIVGSRVLAGRFNPATLDLTDVDGISAAEALKAYGLDPEKTGKAVRSPESLLGYVELHIEQGPVLEQSGVALGCVTGIAGAGRMIVEIAGEAGHAGTVPMAGRRDALTASAECVLAVEEICRNRSSVGTVGMLQVDPSATNVIPGRVKFSIDIRSIDNASRRQALAEVEQAIERVAERRGVDAQIVKLGSRDTIPCAPWIMTRIKEAIATCGEQAIELPSGAGHDGGSMSRITDFGMIFVRCRGGISHNPLEHVSPEDIELGARALMNFITSFDPLRN